jgi:oligopeptide/dipeptide ABC transporter ATP-binding protein
MLLIANNLSKKYFIEKGFLSNKLIATDALYNINFSLKEKTVLGVLGETGSGKTTLAKLVVKLISPTSGNITYNTKNGSRSIQMIFQNPFTSLNPRMKIINSLKDAFLIHKLANSKNINSKMENLLDMVSLDRDCLQRFPDEFSGGQRQRISIARAISVNPQVLLCDEPTASLDLSIQAQILNLFVKLKYELGLSYIFISHNIEVISFIADEILILYKGRQVERGHKDKVLNNPCHPYTKILLGKDIGQVSNFDSNNNKTGCIFCLSCKNKLGICNKSEPSERKIDEDHYVSCHNLK